MQPWKFVAPAGGVQPESNKYASLLTSVTFVLLNRLKASHRNSTDARSRSLNCRSMRRSVVKKAGRSIQAVARDKRHASHVGAAKATHEAAGRATVAAVAAGEIIHERRHRASVLYPPNAREPPTA